MKQLVAVAVVSACLGGVGVYAYAYAQRGGIVSLTSPQPESKFERLVLKKGQVVVREFYRLGSIGQSEWTVIHGFVPGSRDTAVALRISVTSGGRRERAGTLDADEVLSLQAAFPRIEAMFANMPSDPYAEVEFRTSSARIGFFRASNPSFYVHVGGLDDDIAFIEPNQAQRLHELIDNAAAKVKELQR